MSKLNKCIFINSYEFILSTPLVVLPRQLAPVKCLPVFLKYLKVTKCLMPWLTDEKLIFVQIPVKSQTHKKLTSPIKIRRILVSCIISGYYEHFLSSHCDVPWYPIHTMAIQLINATDLDSSHQGHQDHTSSKMATTQQMLISGEDICSAI